MSEADTGAVVGPEHSSVAIRAHGDKVVLAFPKAVEWIALDAETARQLAEAMARTAYEARYGRPPASGGSQVSNEKRERLVTRVSLMLASFARQTRMPSNGAMAMQIVDTLLAEIL